MVLCVCVWSMCCMRASARWGAGSVCHGGYYVPLRGPRQDNVLTAGCQWRRGRVGWSLVGQEDAQFALKTFYFAFSTKQRNL